MNSPCCDPLNSYSSAAVAALACTPSGPCESPGPRIVSAHPLERPHPATVARCRSAFAPPTTNRMRLNVMWSGRVSRAVAVLSVHHDDDC